MIDCYFCVFPWETIDWRKALWMFLSSKWFFLWFGRNVLSQAVSESKLICKRTLSSWKNGNMDDWIIFCFFLSLSWSRILIAALQRVWSNIQSVEDYGACVFACVRACVNLYVCLLCLPPRASNLHSIYRIDMDRKWKQNHFPQFSTVNKITTNSQLEQIQLGVERKQLTYYNK